jgi:pimeloyl-ACP methyl ester carboxylesterase
MGSGPALVYLHAFGETMAFKAPFFGAMAQNFRVVSFDQRGWGETKVHGEMSLDQSAKDAHELIEFLGLEKVYLVGYSMGATCLLAYVRKYGTEHLDRLGFIDMGLRVVSNDDWKFGGFQGWYHEDDWQKDKVLLQSNMRDFMINFIYQTIIPNTPDKPRDFAHYAEKYEVMKVALKDIPGGADAMITVPPELEATYKAYIISMVENDFRSTPDKIDKPIALVYSRPGSLYDERVVNYIASKVKQPELYPVDNATHMLVNTHFAEVIQKLTEFGKKSF